ncbi:hypothetical protein ACQKD9_19890 [Bacillus paramycoides]|uniref:hypothetical protein n=1 Tax=Bacillus paramycoides TaxID=2026194 RepID=UPI003CFF2F25
MSQPIIKIYEDILSGKRESFPKNTWSMDTQGELIKLLTRHLINNILKWDDTEIKEKWNLRTIKKWRLSGACGAYFNESPYKMLDAAFPNQFKPWELKCTPKNYWTRENSLECLRYWIKEKDKLTRNQLLNTYNRNWLKERHLDSPFQTYWNSSPYKMLDAAFPGQFKPWDLRKTPHNYWNSKRKSLKVFKRIIKELNMSNDDIKLHYSLRWIIQHGLRTPLTKFFDDSPYKMLNAAFPEQFKPWDLNDAPNKTWTNKEKTIEIIKNEIEKSELSITDLLQIGVRKWMKDNKLSSPFNIYWNSSPSQMLSELYPEEFIDEYLE